MNISIPRPRMPAHLRAALVSNLTDASGSQLLTLTLDLLAVVSFGFSATQIGLLNALGTISWLVLAVPLGMAVDARGPFRSLLASLLLKTVLALTTLALLLSGRLGVASAMLLALLFGLATVTTETAQTSLVAHLTRDADAITDTVARMASADRMAAIACPAVVGVAVAHRHGAWLFAASALLLVVAGLALGRARVLPSGVPDGPGIPDDSVTSNDAAAGASGPVPASTGERLPLQARLRHGFAMIVRDRTLLGSILLVTAGNMGLAIGDSVEIILVVRHLHLGTPFYGLLGTVGAVSGLLASAVAPRLVRGRSLRTVFAVGGLAQAVVAALPLVALLVPRASRIVLLGFTLGWALVVTLCNIAGSAWTAAAVPRESLGRASAAARTLTMGSVPVAAFAGGVLADRFGIGTPLVLWPVLTLVAALAFLTLARDTATR